MPIQNTLKQQIQQEANHCVKCGLCANACPTYRLTRNECESPRGRIALMDGLAREQLEPSKKLVQHLDHCLTCRACEAVCPAEVKYGNLIDQTRELLQQDKKTYTKPSRLMRLFSQQPRLLYLVGKALQYYQQSRLNKLCRASGLLKLLKLNNTDALLPTTFRVQPWKKYYPATHTQRGDVALFHGCVGNVFDQATLRAAIKVLNRCGYGVHVPRQQGCCGGLALHAGDKTVASKLAQNNIDVFNALEIDHIITTSSGCQAVLQEYHHGEQNSALPAIDINQFLQQITWPDDMVLKPLAKRVALHTPCSLRNVLKQSHTAFDLLEKIPELTIERFSDSSYCCGAAGMYVFNQAEKSQALLNALLDNRESSRIDIVATSNVGCLLQLYKGNKQQKFCQQLMHPVQIVAQQLL